MPPSKRAQISRPNDLTHRPIMARQLATLIEFAFGRVHAEKLLFEYDTAVEASHSATSDGLRGEIDFVIPQEGLA